MKRHTLRTARQKRGLTIPQLARLASLHRSIVYRLDDGVCQPSINTAEALEKALGVKHGTLKFPKPRKADQVAA